MENDLFQLPVTVLDCQTTGASPSKGFLLEMAWTILVSSEECSPDIHSFLVAQPAGEPLPGRITRMTGIKSVLPGEGIADCELAKLLLPALKYAVPVAHFAVFEQRWIDDLYSRYLPDEEIPRIICTREISRRLYPGLPRKGIRAVTGFMGHSMDEKKRAAGHVFATVHIWKRIVSDLRERGIRNLSQLYDFIAEPLSHRSGSWDYPLPRETRLSIPDSPGVYRLLSQSEEVLYVGKASSLRKRVNSYFTKRRADEKTLELVSQVHDIFTSVCETPLEAALLEFSTIRRFDPPYNVALRKRDYGTFFLSNDMSSCSSELGNGFIWGPVPEHSPALLLNEILEKINQGGCISEDRLGLDYLPLERGALESGFSIFRDEFDGDSPVSLSSLLSAGLAAWLSRNDEKCSESGEKEGDREPVVSVDDEGVRNHLEWLVAAGARALRRGSWFRLLGWSSLLWKPLLSNMIRSVVLREGKILSSAWFPGNAALSPEPVCSIKKQLHIDSELYDLLRVLDSEVRRITTDGSLIGILLPGGKHLDREKLKRLYRFI